MSINRPYNDPSTRSLLQQMIRHSSDTSRETLQSAYDSVADAAMSLDILDVSCPICGAQIGIECRVSYETVNEYPSKYDVFVHEDRRTVFSYTRAAILSNSEKAASEAYYKAAYELFKDQL